MVTSTSCVAGSSYTLHVHRHQCFCVVVSSFAMLAKLLLNDEVECQFLDCNDPLHAPTRRGKPTLIVLPVVARVFCFILSTAVML